METSEQLIGRLSADCAYRQSHGIINADISRNELDALLALARKGLEAERLKDALSALVAVCPTWMSSGADASSAMTEARAALAAKEPSDA